MEKNGKSNWSFYRFSSFIGKIFPDMMFEGNVIPMLFTIKNHNEEVKKSGDHHNNDHHE